MLNTRAILWTVTGTLVFIIVFASNLTPRVTDAAIDRTAPVIKTFIVPTTSSKLSVTGITLTASDNVGVTGYYLNTSPSFPSPRASGWKSTAPTSYTFSSAGTKVLYAWAKDAAGNVSARLSRSVTIDIQAPTVSITSPVNNASVVGTITIRASATDNIRVAMVEFYIDDILKITDTFSPYSYSVNTATLASGTHFLRARAYDAAGNSSLSAAVSITVNIPGQDTIAPKVNTFSIPATARSLTVTVTAFAAYDNIGVTGYLLTVSATKPLADADGWKTTPPASYLFSNAGANILYAWAKDAAGNVSDSLSAVTFIDVISPGIDTFTLPSTSSTLRVTGIMLSASDDVGVTGYYLSNSSITPGISSTDWRAVAPASYTFTSAGTNTLYAWAKDAAGNISPRQSASVTITLPTATFEINVAEAGAATLHSPWDTWAQWTPDAVSPSDKIRSPMITYVALFNATGGMPDLPQNELYDEDAYGNPVYHFERLTTKLDSILAAGFTPYIVLSYTPLKLASNPAAIGEFSTNTSPPRDWDKYYNYIRAFFETLSTTYGADVVASWRFRCGTEPDNKGWWSGTMEEWFKFYDYTISAARAANPNVSMRINVNPGNYMVWGSQFISGMAGRIQTGIFSIPGESPIVPSVISFSYYSDDPSKISTATAAIRTALAPYSKFAGIPLCIDEGYIIDDENGRIMFSRLDGTELGGAHFALLTTTIVEQNVLWGALWNTGSATIPPPARNVLDLFQQQLVGGTLLNLSKTAAQPLSNDVVGGLAVRPVGAAGGQTRLMMFNYNTLRSAASSESVLLRLRGVPAGGVNVTLYRIDRTHANYSAQWLADSAGIPRNAYPPFELSPYDLDPTDGIIQEGRDLWTANKATYEALSKVTPEVEQIVRIPAADGTLEIPFTLPPHGVLFMQLDPVGP